MKKLFVDIRDKNIDNIHMDVLSNGHGPAIMFRRYGRVPPRYGSAPRFSAAGCIRRHNVIIINRRFTNMGLFDKIKGFIGDPEEEDDLDMEMDDEMDFVSKNEDSTEAFSATPIPPSGTTRS